MIRQTRRVPTCAAWNWSPRKKVLEHEAQIGPFEQGLPDLAERILTLASALSTKARSSDGARLMLVNVLAERGDAG